MAAGLSAKDPRVGNIWRHPVTGLEAVALSLLFVTHVTSGIHLIIFVPNLSLPCCFLFQGSLLQPVSGLLKPIDQRSAGAVPPLVNSGWSMPGASRERTRELAPAPRFFAEDQYYTFSAVITSCNHLFLLM